MIEAAQPAGLEHHPEAHRAGIGIGRHRRQPFRIGRKRRALDIKAPAMIANADPARLADVPASIAPAQRAARSEEHTSELQSLMRISYAVFCLKTQQPTK